MERLRLEMHAALVLVAICGGIYFGLPAAAPPARPAAGAVGEVANQGMRLVVFETASCGWCVKFRKEIAPVYLETSYQVRAPLEYVSLRRSTSPEFKLTRSVNLTPTFVLVDRDGREVGRTVGFPQTSGQFYSFLDKYL